ncbi:hypothetical protein MBLNU457_6611t1 [Dothideomycetes sp. NU457]
MYTNRRPVPSKAALQILRQLAYISSGTICGAAALVAEERRRQTCIAKKIVENSKRIKQHPRYAHGAAAVALQEAEFTLNDNDIVIREQEGRTESGQTDTKPTQDAQIRRGSVGQSRALDFQLAPRDSVLPSEVDRGYRRTVLREDSRSVRRSQHNHAKPTLEFSKSRSRLEGNKHEPGSRRTTSPVDETSTRTGLDALTNASESVLEAKRWRDKIHTSLAHDLGQRWYDQAIRRLDLVKLTGALDKSKASFASHVIVTKPSVNMTSHPGTLRNAVQTFLDLHPPPDLRRRSTRTLIGFVANLLNRAAEQGETWAVFALLRWLDAHNDLRLEHVKCVTDRADILLRNVGFDTLTHGELLDGFRLPSVSDKDGGRLKIIAAIFSDLAKARALDRTHVKLLQDLSKSCGYSELVQPLTVVCLQLAQSEDFKNAVGLFNLSRSASSSHDLVPLARRLLDLGVQSTKSADFRDHKILLVFLHKLGESLSDPIEKLLTNADAAKRLADAVDVCQEFLPRHALSASSYRLFIVGLSRTNHINSIPLFLSQLPLPLGSDVLIASQRQWSSILRRQMKETGNFPLVSKTFDSMRQLAGTGKLPVTVYNTMIRICMQSGQDNKAQQVVRLLRDEDQLSPDVGTFMSWILGNAENENWEEVDRYLHVLKEDAFDIIDPEKRAHILHPLIAVYAKHHEPDEVWNFATNVFNKHGATMHRATFSIVLKTLIRGKYPDRIHDWLAFVRKQGLELDLNASDAVDAFREYYYAWQPRSQIFSHLVRRLAYECPHLVSRELLLLNINAVGQDIRNEVGYGTRAASREAHLEAGNALRNRLALMSTEDDAQDSPEASQQLFLPDSEGSIHTNVELAAPLDAGLTGDKAELMAVDSGYGSDTEFSSPGSPAREPTDDEPRDIELTDIEPADIEPTDIEPTHIEPTDIDQWPTKSSQSMSKDRRHSMHYERSLLKSKMLYEMTIGRPEEALKLYRESLSATGLPMSTVTMAIAVEAGLAVEQSGRELADEIVQDARNAGMDTTSTLTPLMVHYFQNLGKDRENAIANVDKLVENVLKFYRTMLDKKLPVTHHVPVTAARTMIRFGHPRKAVHLLRQIHLASQTYRLQTYRANFDIVAYNVFMKAYVACGNEKGAAWIVRQVLSRNIHIDRKFLLGLKHNAALLRSRRSPIKDRSKRESLINALVQWRGECCERRGAQIQATADLGNRILEALVVCSEPLPQREGAFGIEETRPLRIRQMHAFSTLPAQGPTEMEMLGAKREYEGPPKTLAARQSEVARQRRIRRAARKKVRKAQETQDYDPADPLNQAFSKAVTVADDLTAASPSWI